MTQPPPPTRGHGELAPAPSGATPAERDVQVSHTAPGDLASRATHPRVTHVIASLFKAGSGTLGGAERYALELARNMADVVPTMLVSFGEEDREESIGNLRIRVIGDPWYVRGNRHNPVSLRLVREMLRSDVVHCHQRSVLMSSLLALSGRVLGKRVVVTDLGGGGWDLSAYVATDRWYHRHLHISEYSRTVAGHVGMPWARVISGGVDTVKFTPGALRDPRGPVLFVGRLMPHKGIHDLIAGTPPEIPLVLIGQPYDPGYFEHLRSLATGRDVTFRHECDDRALVEAYQRAMCVVLPSVYDSGFQPPTKVPELLGQTLLEGMACGIPAICTDVASMPEVVVDGETGWVVPPNNPGAIGAAISSLRHDPATALAMGTAGRRRIEQEFTWAAVVRRCLDAYGD